MTGKERMEAAFSREGTAEIPAVVFYEYILLRDHWRALTDCPWWYQYSYDIDTQIQWRRQAYERLGQDFFDLTSFGTRDDRDHMSIAVRPQGVFLLDQRTGKEVELHEPMVGGGSDYAHSLLTGNKAETPEELDEIISIRQYDPAAAQKSGTNDMAGALIREFDDLYPAKSVMAPLGECFLLWNFEDAMIKTLTNPALIDHACQRFLSRTIQEVRRAAAMGARCIFIEDAYGDMISPEHYIKFGVEYSAQVVEEIRSLGMKSIFYFTGNPAGKMDLIFSINADALSFEESKKNFTIDIDGIADKSKGRFVLLGNLDAIGVLQNGSDQQLKDEIKRQIAAGRKNKGRFIMSLGSPVTPETSIERVRLYCDTVHDLGRL